MDSVLGMDDHFPWNALLSALWNIVNTILGAGTLSMPYVVLRLGPGGFLAITCLVLLASYTSSMLLLKACDAAEQSLMAMSPNTQQRRLPLNRRSSFSRRVGWMLSGHSSQAKTLRFCNYESLALFYYGERGAYAVIFVFVCGGIGLSMAYLLLIAQTVAPLVLGHAPNHTEQDMFVVAIAIFGALPLALVRDISRLRGPSFLGCVALLYVTAFGVVKCILRGPDLEQDIALMEDVDWGWQMLPAIAMVTSAFSCHISTLPVYSSLGTHREVMPLVIFLSMLCVFLVYVGIGLSGYFLFGEATAQNILVSMWASTPTWTEHYLLVLMNVCVSVSLLTSLPIVIWPLRSCLLLLLHRLDILLGRTTAKVDDAPEPSSFLWVTITVAIILVVTSIALLTPQVAVALSIVGAVGGAGIVFIFPSLFFLGSRSKQLDDTRSPGSSVLGAKILLGLGACMGSLSLAVTVHNITHGRS
eukprot:TRINITY_DN1558_c0_g1_i2.p1 TRINITY_DN1558_c0_g1~~TRINITY_DN1558_c0_g1_i2.p1  ORF type:complete len:487 (+),score=46.76 TRINITY_DN1558_c0_g1_i2:48-1463(+)